MYQSCIRDSVRRLYERIGLGIPVPMQVKGYESHVLLYVSTFVVGYGRLLVLIECAALFTSAIS